ncbi:MAG: DUF4445 domain-containing protein, partial [Deltaproteobacteria bacterium]|nr:DUF4445 domain-containing protein [Deltaproteobacteria bacterium]
ISRIAYADGRESGLADLQGLVVEAINDLAGRCLEKAGGQRAEIDEVTVVGNTTMEQILAGFHPHGLGAAPYLPLKKAMLDFRAADLGLDLNPATNVHLFPVISGFIGGDTLGAILAVRPHDRDEISLIVDIGTNGELVLGNRQGLWATSCATGPALEGAHMSCGMRAGSGAIHRVEHDPASGRLVYEVLGQDNGARPAGLCGSGIIDAVAALRRAGLLLENGRFNEGRPEVNVDDQGVGRSLTLAGPEASATGAEVALTLADVRQVQLAKAALFVGIKFLMQAAGLKEVDRLFLTGAFGARFNWQSALAIGMLPPGAVSGEVETLENAAGQGAILALLDGQKRDEARRLTEMVQVIDLAADPGFNLEFPRATVFPALDSSPAEVD